MKLKEYIQREKLCKFRIATSLGIHRNHFDGIVNGITTPRLPLAQKIVKFTNNEVTLDDLVGRAPKQRNQRKVCTEEV